MNEMNDHSNPATPLIEENLTCNSECGLDLKLGQGCDGHECKYIPGIQSETKPKCFSCHGFGYLWPKGTPQIDMFMGTKPPKTEKNICQDCNGSGIQPEQTEEDKIRADWNNWFEAEFHPVDPYVAFSAGAKSRQPEIESMKCCGNCDNYDICMFSGDHHCINWTIKESE